MKAITTVLFLLFSVNPVYADNVKEIFLEMREQFNKIEDYKCIMEDYQSKGEKSERYVYNYYYKKSNKIRMEITGGDKNVGTVLIHRDGKVKVKPGRGILSLFTFVLNPENKRIKGLNGYRVNETAGDYFLDRHIENFDNFYGSVIRSEEIDGRKTLVVELVSKNPDETSSIARELIWVDKERMLLLKFILYDDDGVILQSTQYKNININAGLSNELFEHTTIRKR